MGGTERVVVMGASNKPDRYSYKAVSLLKEKGHEVIPVHPALREVLGLSVVDRIENVEGPVDTVTLYISPKLTEELADAILAKKPRRIIANPGAESETMRKKAEAAGIKYIEACTLVLLKTGQF
jgi:predicted CoA-binding protein